MAQGLATTPHPCAGEPRHAQLRLCRSGPRHAQLRPCRGPVGEKRQALLRPSTFCPYPSADVPEIGHGVHVQIGRGVLALHGLGEATQRALPQPAVCVGMVTWALGEAT